MENNNTQVVIDSFEIPEDLAKELSDLLTKQTIREKLALQVIDDPEKYDIAEDRLMPITAKIEAIKVKITKEYVPSKYNSEKYMWNYDGYDVSGNKVEIVENL